jgi:ribosomal-protein-alanine N-acetyltransferase
MDIKIDISNTTLTTDRLILRPWCVTDLDDLYEYASVPGVGEMAGWKHHESKEASAQILKRFIEKKEVFAVTDRETGKAIGSLGLHYSWANDDEQFASLRQREIGYVLSKAYWGRD